MNIKIKLKDRVFIVMNSTDDLKKTIALTFWETKEDMDTYHKLNNKWFNIITEILHHSNACRREVIVLYLF